ncbi:MAG: hypothetical protein R2778_03105 [Saprospiraceae bacterium]
MGHRPKFPVNIYEITEAMLVILRSGGLQGGGVNFDAKTRRNSTDLEDIFYAHIGGMDTFARALLAAHDILEKSPFTQMRSERYASFDKRAGRHSNPSKLSLEDRVNWHQNAEANAEQWQAKSCLNIVSRCCWRAVNGNSTQPGS